MSRRLQSATGISRCPPHFAPSLSCWRYSLSLANLSALNSAGASSLTTKGTINFFCNPFSFTSHTNARLPRLKSLAHTRSHFTLANSALAILVPYLNPENQE